PQEGDTWFWVNGDKSGIKVFVNGDWVEPVDSDTQEKIAASVTEAVSQAKAHTDEVKQGLSSDIETAKSQAASQASAAEANAKSEATSLFSTAQNALSDAKKDLIKSIEHEASARNEAVADANSKAQNYVNEAKKDINDTINAFSVGGRNLLLGTANGVTGVGSNSINDAFGLYYLAGGKKVSDLYNQYGSSGYLTISFDWVASGSTISGTFLPQWVGNPWGGLSDSDIKVSSTNSSGHYEHTVALSTDGYSTGWASAIRFRQDYLQGNITITNLKLESGNKATDWSPAPEDVVLDYTTKDNKIKETITQYQETNDGLVSKLQTSVKTALEQIETKISQTDFNQKTGELSKTINDTKDTADKSLKTIGDIQEADGKRDYRISEVEKTAGEIKQTVSDITNAQGKQSGYISTLQQRADGFVATVTKVDNLSIGGRNLLIGTATPWAVQANDNNFNFNSIYDHLKGGTTYTFSAEISVSNGQDSVSVGAFDAPIGTTWGFSHNFSKGVKRGSFTFTTPDHIDNDGHFLVYAGTQAHTAGLSATYTHMKLEEGNIPTAWTPAPEDTETVLAQVKHTADSISNFVRDSSGNISSDFQTALSRTSIITGSTLASSIQKQTSSQISSAITDNNGKIISLINQDSSGVQIAGENIVLDGDTTVTGDFYAKGGNFKNLNASNLTVGTLNGSQVNITNINANNIVSGAISGANLNINLNTGSVVFQKGRIN
ncbi:gp58-like family protein, partial [Leuconostoc falkenbergense]|uniref:gp58-like family protein n=1 Tax=Leuconostoc falkenbergense TaxID=2766470 RepID=UPI0021AA475F